LATAGGGGRGIPGRVLATAGGGGRGIPGRVLATAGGGGRGISGRVLATARTVGFVGDNGARAGLAKATPVLVKKTAARTA